MTPGRWSEVKLVFAEAITRPAVERETLVRNRCGEDAELLRLVMALLSSHDRAADFLEASPVEGLAARAAADGPWSGRTRGPYRIGQRVGVGGMGEVYDAVDVRSGERVAIKVLTDDGADAARRLEREARRALELDHPNVCRMLEFAEDADGAFIAMELLYGAVLDDLIPPGGLDAGLALPLARQLAAAMAHAHARGLVHRDLKGANVMVQADGTVKVLDFGLARRLSGPAESAVSAATLTDARVVAGTLSYLAPEVLRGERADARSDVWAFGVILHELLSGGQPFEGRTTFELTSAALREPAAPLPPGIPAGLRLIRDSCLAKDPEERYRDGGELLAALDAFAVGARVPTRTRRRPVVRRRTAVGVLAVVTVAVAAWLSGAGSMFSRPQTSSVAVLPITFTSSDPADAYFADGLTEALIRRIGTVEALRVISPSSVRRYREDAAPGDVGRELGVEFLVRGSVDWTPDLVRLAIEVVEAVTARVVLKQMFERHPREILALENDAARAVIGHLDIPVSPSARTRLEVVRAVDPVVHEAYLKGRFYWNKRTTESLRQAMQFFSRAIELDPTYAPAHAALADCYNQLGTFLVGTVSPAEARPLARASAVAAIQADESLAEAHATLGYVSHYDWDWETAAREFRRALDLNPNLALAHVWYANYLMSRRRLEEALAEVQRAEALDPFSLVVVTNVGWVLAYAGRHAEALEAYDRALALDPGYVQARWRRADALFELGQVDEALRDMQRLAEDTGSGTSGRSRLARAYAQAGRQTEARAMIDDLLALPPTVYVSPVGMYGALFAIGDLEQGFVWLERAVKERSNGIAYISYEASVREARRDPRYTALLQPTGVLDAR